MMTSIFDSLNPSGSFRFSSSKSPLDWNKLKVLDIDKIIATRDVQTLVSNLDILIACNIDAEIKKSGFNEIFIKLFRLSQLALEFLLHCKVFLQRSLSRREEELQLLKQEVLINKRNIPNKTTEKKKKSQLVLTAAVESASFKCSSCQKIFVSDGHLKYHISKQHAQNGICTVSLKPKQVAGSVGGQTSFSCSTPIKKLSPNKDLHLKSDSDHEALPPGNKSEDSISSHSKAATRLEELLVNMEIGLPNIDENSDKNKLETHNNLNLNKGPSQSPDKVTNKNQSKNNTSAEVDIKDVSDSGVGKMAETIQGENFILPNLDIGPMNLSNVDQMVRQLSTENLDYQNNIKFLERVTSGEEYISDEDEILTVSESSSSSEDIDMDRLRIEIEHEFENKLRSLGIDPEWHKIPLSVAKTNEASLSALRNSYAKKDRDFYTIRNQLIAELDYQLLHTKKKPSTKADLRNETRTDY